MSSRTTEQLNFMKADLARQIKVKFAYSDRNTKHEDFLETTFRVGNQGIRYVILGEFINDRTSLALSLTDLRQWKRETLSGII